MNFGTSLPPRVSAHTFLRLSRPGYSFAYYGFPSHGFPIGATPYLLINAEYFRKLST